LNRTTKENVQPSSTSAPVVTPKLWQPIRESLEEFALETRKEIQKPHNFRFVSQAQAVPAAKAMLASEGLGPANWQQRTSSGDTRAALYDQSFSAQKLKAFVIVSMVSCIDHAELAVLAIDQGRGGMPITLIRGLIERIAIANSVKSAISSLMAESADAEKFMNSFYLGDYHSVILKSIYGTRVDWIKLASSELENAKRKEYEYKANSEFADESAEQILNRVDQLSKEVKGTRLAYDVFCEFLHPNSGDLYSATQISKIHVDSWGTRHVTRMLGIGERSFGSEPQLASVISSSLKIAESVLKLGRELHKSLDSDADTFLKVNKKVMHAIRKKQRHLFKQDDLCPCLSGKRISFCK